MTGGTSDAMGIQVEALSGNGTCPSTVLRRLVPRGAKGAGAPRPSASRMPPTTRSRSTSRPPPGRARSAQHA